MSQRLTGMMEYWSDGIMERNSMNAAKKHMKMQETLNLTVSLLGSYFSTFQYSNIPIIPLDTSDRN